VQLAEVYWHVPVAQAASFCEVSVRLQWTVRHLIREDAGFLVTAMRTSDLLCFIQCVWCFKWICVLSDKIICINCLYKFSVSHSILQALDPLLPWHIKLHNYTHFCAGLSVRFEVLRVVLLKIPLFFDVMLCYVSSSKWMLDLGVCQFLQEVNCQHMKLSWLRT
jgi:hypothetical protein